MIDDNFQSGNNFDRFAINKHGWESSRGSTPGGGV